ncbi:FIST N-terminal domain-containing protein [Thauera sp.]|jgi:small ligand-binding sensory domain FIST|uniref:FIST signal transduction protein n=1 Tax=Thauera sp. TaxID=1905334 RepID=UPI00260DDEBE|nr:FIST N-terminal domain-containing protein [Thauera sp.]MCK6409826.1 FIST C-terminal domain-containing protein [Thauera sp.]
MIPTRFATGHAAHPDWQVALARALDALLQDARVATAQAAAAGREAMPEFTLGFCYLSDRLADATADIVAELQRRLPGVHWVGTVGIGVVATGAEHFDEPALSLMLAALPRRAFRVFSGIQPLRAEGADFHPYTALVHADGRTPDLQELLPELAARTASGYLFGGLSASRRRSVQIADTVFDGGGLSGVAFAAEVGVVSRVTQGCQPIGPRRVVSRVQDNVVIALDGRGALDCALEDLGLPPDMALEPVAEALSRTLVGLHPKEDAEIVAPAAFGADMLVRNIVGLDPRAGVVAIGDEVEKGAWLMFVRRDPAAALADLRRAAREIRDELVDGGRVALGAVYVSCSGRGGPHFGKPAAELEVIRDVIGDLPLTGFFAGGEIAHSRLYGYTGVLTVFTAAR